MKLLAVMLMLGGIAAPLGAADAPRVTIDTGVLQGASENGIRRFLGIPYAAPPVGDLRWRPPQPAAAWDGVRAAAAHGHACPQVIGKYKADWPNDAMLAAGLDEDCLTVKYLDARRERRAFAGYVLHSWRQHAVRLERDAAVRRHGACAE